MCVARRTSDAELVLRSRGAVRTLLGRSSMIVGFSARRLRGGSGSYYAVSRGRAPGLFQRSVLVGIPVTPHDIGARAVWQP